RRLAPHVWVGPLAHDPMACVPHVTATGVGRRFRGETVRLTLRGACMALACLLLAACASAPEADSSKIGDVERAASVGPGGFLMYAPTSFGTANGGRKNVDFIPGVFAQSATRVHILSYDRLAKTFRQDMSFETASIRGVAMVSGPFGRKQLQIKTETGVIAC